MVVPSPPLFSQYTEQLYGVIPSGHGVSVIIKARQGHYYRVRTSAGQLLTEFQTLTQNTHYEIKSCDPGVCTVWCGGLASCIAVAVMLVLSLCHRRAAGARAAAHHSRLTRHWAII